MIENQNQSQEKAVGSEAQKEPKFNGSFFKFASIMLTMVVAGLVASYVWQTYVSPQARANRQMEEQYRKYQEFEAYYKQAMANDTYGGKTPQETLDLFIAALEKNDLELASKYFALNSVGQQDEKWTRELERIKKANETGYLISFIEHAILTEQSNVLNTAFFLTKDGSGKVLGEIFLKLNQYSKVWKIESI